MADASERTLYGSTIESGSVPGSNNGPVYSDDGRLILAESFTNYQEVWDVDAFKADIESMRAGEDYVESWGIWDCCEDDWANTALELHRFEDFDLAVNVSATEVCTWRGALDTHARVLASRDPEDCAQKCWQWLRKN